MTSWDYLSKFVIVGDASCGKSSLLIRLTEQRFLADVEPTVGVEFGSYIVKIDDEQDPKRPATVIKCQVWDTAGSETFRSITRSYYRGAAGALLVYNVTHRPSFLHIVEWLRDIRQHAEENVSIVLVGNMADLCEDDEAEEAAAEEEEEEGEEGDSAEAVTSADDDRGEAAEHDAQADSSSSPSKTKRKAGKRAQRRDGQRSSRNRSSRRQVTKQEAQEFAEREGMMFVETSAKTGQNVEDAFKRAAKDIYAKFQVDASQRPKGSTGNRTGLQGGQNRPGVVAASMQSVGTDQQGRQGCCTIA